MTDWIRVSEGTGTVVGLWDRRLASRPTTAYLMTYREEGCTANCKFCPQARSSDSPSDKLSRVSWPKVEFGEFISSLTESDHSLERVCLQALNYQEVVDDLVDLTSALREVTDLPISVSCQPVEKEDMIELRDAGVNRMGVPLDASTERTFDEVKGRSAGGPYRWSSHLDSLEEALEVFDGDVSTHLLVGLGESEKEIMGRIQDLHDREITVALFAFTPVEGSQLENLSPPDLHMYRRVQIARHLIEENLTSFDLMEFEGGMVRDFGIDQRDLIRELSSGEAFKTSGCPGCNRPYYNESPGGPIFNYPENPSETKIDEILERLEILG